MGPEKRVSSLMKRLILLSLIITSCTTGNIAYAAFSSDKITATIGITATDATFTHIGRSTPGDATFTNFAASGTIHHTKIGSYGAADSTFTGVSVTSANNNGIINLSGNTSSYTAIGVGRTSIDGRFGVAGGAGHYSDLANIGDIILSNSTDDLILTARNASGNIYLSTANPDTAKMTILNSGDVGIGVTPSVAKLHVVKSNGDGGAFLSGNSGNYTAVGVGRELIEGRFAVAAGDGHYSDLSSAGDFIVQSGTSDLILTARNASGNIILGTAATDTAKLTISSAGNVLVNGFSSSTVGLTVKGAASQSANLQEWQNSAGSIQASIGSGGDATFLQINSTKIGNTTAADATFTTARITSSGDSSFNSITVNRPGGTTSCVMWRDTDDAGWTECFALNGTLSCTTDADGVCDGA